MLKKGYIFNFCSKVPGKKIFLTPHSMILREVSFSTLKYEYLGKIETKNKNILTYWSVAQAGSNDEKNLGVKNLVGLSL